MSAPLNLKIIIGHRGTGKSSFLQRLALSLPEYGPFYDLDLEIEKAQNRSIEEIFLTNGEKYFRKLEAEIFQKLTLKAQIICVGAGFRLENIPESSEVIWIRRPSDTQGRIFLDRPQLLKNTPALAEYEIKRKDRDPLFLARANLIYTMPEGLFLSEVGKKLETQLFKARWSATSHNIIRKGSGLKTFFPSDLRLSTLAKPEYFELRDDVLSPLQMKSYSESFADSRSLYSSRIEKLSALKENEKIVSGSALIDLPIKTSFKIALNKGQRLIHSSHQDDIESGISELDKAFNVHLKLSPLVTTWKDIFVGHQWQQKDPEHRSFLPRSTEGRWKWYRLYQKGRQDLNFWYESESSAADQPSLLEWLMQPEKVLSFAAVLGSPVQQSLSPMMHFDFFNDRKSCFFAIDIKEDEWLDAFPILQSLGLVAAAVTSPLKKRAYLGSYLLTDLANELKAVNTLVWNKNKKNWQAENTDFLGFVKFLKNENLSNSVVIWGGEGVLSMLQKALPQASAYSVRTGKPKEKNHEINSPSVLIWAAPFHNGILFPPNNWQPKTIVDLNYAETSLGRKYAMETQGRYISGLEFFRLQALEQQKFWLQFLDQPADQDNR